MFFESSGKNAEMQKKPPVQETEAVFSLGRFEPDELTGYLEGIKNRAGTGAGSAAIITWMRWWTRDTR